MKNILFAWSDDAEESYETIAKIANKLKSVGRVVAIPYKTSLLKDTKVDHITDLFNCPSVLNLRNWAHCLVIAPITAHTIAELSLGLCDKNLTNLFRSWDWRKPVFIAPSMEKLVWLSSLTNKQIYQLNSMSDKNLKVVLSKSFMSQEFVFADPDEILEEVKKRFKWVFPLHSCNGIPINHHPGAFGFRRAKNHHTGVDLYTEDGADVLAVEDGVVVKVDVFTGPKAGHDWWEETYAIMVEGNSGVVNYGEVNKPTLNVGDEVQAGDVITTVKRVLFKDKFRKDIPGHSTSMLHLELYKTGTREFAHWHDLTKNPYLLDPTVYLLESRGEFNALTWDNQEKRSVGGNESGNASKT